MTESTGARSGPLDGLRVLEAANYISGPFAGQALADLGAQVTKLEPPSGDPYRRFGPEGDDGGVMFNVINRGKASERIDLKEASGVARLHDLLGEVDVFTSNWRPSVAADFGLTPATRAERWPNLVWLRVSGFGQTGPMAEAPAFDAIIQARTGVVDALSHGTPTLPPMLLADKITAMIAAQSVLAALVERNRTGTGAVVDVSMLDALGYFNTPDLSAGHQLRTEPDPGVMAQLRVTRPLPTSDGSIVLSPVSGRQLKRSLDAAGLGSHADELKRAPDRRSMSGRFFELMEQRLPEASTEHWVAVFEAADVPVTPVLDVATHLDDPQVLHNELYPLVERPDGSVVRSPRYPARFDDAATAAAPDAPA